MEPKRDEANRDCETWKESRIEARAMQAPGTAWNDARGRLWGRVVFQAVTTCRNAGWMSGDGARQTVDMTGSRPVLDHSISLLGPRQGSLSQQLLGSQLSFCVALSVSKWLHQKSWQ